MILAWLNRMVNKPIGAHHNFWDSGQALKLLFDLTVRKQLGESASVQLFSSLKRQGAEEARDVLESFLSGGGDDQ